MQHKDYLPPVTSPPHSSLVVPAPRTAAHRAGCGLSSSKMKYHSKSVIASGWNGPFAWTIKKQGKEIKTRWATALLFSPSASCPPPSPPPCCLWDDTQKHQLSQPALNYSILFEPGKRHAMHSPKNETWLQMLICKLHKCERDFFLVPVFFTLAILWQAIHEHIA